MTLPLADVKAPPLREYRPPLTVIVFDVTTVSRATSVWSVKKKGAGVVSFLAA